MVKVRSHFIPATTGVKERKLNKRPRLMLRKFTPSKKDDGKYYEGELLFKPEKVMPKQALSVKDVIQRFTKGLPIQDPPRSSKPVWPAESMTHDSPDYNSILMMDRQDKADMARSAKINKKAEPKAVAPAPAPETKPKTE